jgi:LacI family transcriptional regulator
MNQHNELAGQAAVDMLIGMLHRSEKGPPPFPQATLIDPAWTLGKVAATQKGVIFS